ncbi:MAG: hypothetical protein ABSG65_20785 [Bryobacteraceae bacterium]|jgi:hypothetical protein
MPSRQLIATGCDWRIVRIIRGAAKSAGVPPKPSKYQMPVLP